jgi:hypothetical protein
MTREADRNAMQLAQDRLIHRCTCGAWVWGSRPCSVCAHLYADKEAAA